MNILEYLKNKPVVILLVGVPLSGKSTFRKKYLNDYNVISMDEMLVEETNSSSLNEAWNKSKDKRIKVNIKRKGLNKILSKILDKPEFEYKYEKGVFHEVHKKLRNRLLEIGKTEESVVIDMTNIRPKTRWNHISKFKNHIKVAIEFDPITFEEYLRRNNKRDKVEDNFIPLHKFMEFLDDYKSVSTDEGFDIIINSKSKLFD